MEILHGNKNEESIASALIELTEHEDQMTLEDIKSKVKSQVIRGYRAENKTMAADLTLEKEAIKGYKSENEILSQELILEKSLSDSRLQVLKGLKVENRQLKGTTEQLNNNLNKQKIKLADSVSRTPKRRRYRSE